MVESSISEDHRSHLKDLNDEILTLVRLFNKYEENSPWNPLASKNNACTQEKALDEAYERNMYEAGVKLSQENVDEQQTNMTRLKTAFLISFRFTTVYSSSMYWIVCDLTRALEKENKALKLANQRLEKEADELRCNIRFFLVSLCIE